MRFCVATSFLNLWSPQRRWRRLWIVGRNFVIFPHFIGIVDWIIVNGSLSPSDLNDIVFYPSDELRYDDIACVDDFKTKVKPYDGMRKGKGVTSDWSRVDGHLGKKRHKAYTMPMTSIWTHLDQLRHEKETKKRWRWKVMPIVVMWMELKQKIMACSSLYEERHFEINRQHYWGSGNLDRCHRSAPRSIRG